MRKNLAGMIVLATLALVAAAWQTPGPIYKECEQGSGPLPTPPASEGCVRANCDNNWCQLGQSVNMDPGSCSGAPTMKRCKYYFGPEDVYYWFDCVPDYDGCTGSDFKCKWQADSSSAHYEKLLKCKNV